MSKIESLDENQKARLKEYILQGRPYDEILKEYPQMNKTNLSNYKSKLLVKDGGNVVVQTGERPQPNVQYIVDSLLNNILICDSEIQSLRDLKHQTSSSKQAIASLIGKKTDSLKELMGFISKLQSDLEMDDVREFIDFLVYKKQKRQSGGS